MRVTDTYVLGCDMCDNCFDLSRLMITIMGIFRKHDTNFFVGLVIYVSILYLCLGCDVKQFNSGSDTENVHFETTIIRTGFITYQVLYDNSPIFSAKFFSGVLQGSILNADDVTPTGDVLTGDFSFTLSGVSTAKAGVYEFLGASNQLSCVKLYILGKPGTPVLSSGSIPEIGGSLTFICSSTSTTFPIDHGLSLTYSWSVNSQTNPSGSKYTYSGNALRISNVQRTDKDKPVSCTTTENVNGGKTSDTSNQRTINVYYGPDAVTLNPSDLSHTVDEGGYLDDIGCNADCYPACTYVWRKKSQASPVSLEKTLPLGNNVKRSYAGEYTCTAYNPDGVGTPVTATVSIYVRYGPESMTMTPPGTSRTVDEGGYIGTIECKASCYPDCIYMWRKQYQNNPESSNKILTIGNNVRRDKTGRYTCTATNPDRAGRPTATATVNIYVRYGPDSMTLTPPQTTRTVDEGGNIGTIECKATCYPDCNFVWRKQYQRIPESRNKILTIGNNVRRDKAGRYTCTATNPDRAGRPTAIATVYIYVRYGPDAVSLQPPQKAYTKNELGTLGAINCSTDCYPSCTVKWTRNSQTYDTNILSLDRLEESDAGNYTCMANNPEKAGSASKVVSVNVRYGPKSILFTPSVTSPLTKIEGQYQDPISCYSRCYPSCSASWKKGTQTTSLATDEVLSLGYVNRSYAGNFRCTSTNDATQYDRTTVTDLILVVQYPPDAAITLEKGDPRDITLKCVAKGEPSSYTFEQWVHIAPDRSTEIQRYSGSVNGGENILVLKNVKYMDSGFYTCKVSNPITTTTTQFGIDNKEIIVKDKPFVIQDPREFDAPQHGTASISVRFYSYDSIKNITWLKIANKTKSKIDSDNNKYAATFGSETVTIPIYTKNITLQGTRSQLNIRDIDVRDYTEYEVHIENSIGEVVILLVVKPRGPPEVPKKFARLPESETSSSIGFTWFPGFHGGADQIFHIEYKSEGHEWKEGARLFGGKVFNQQLQTKVDGLTSGFSYVFRIYASNEYGNSTEKSNELFGSTVKVEDVTNHQEQDDNTASVAGWSVAVVLGLILIVLVLLFLLHKYNRLQVCRNKKKRIETRGVAFSNIKTENNIINLGTAANATEGLNKTRSELSQYETLGTQRESAGPYEGLQPNANRIDEQKSSGNLYDELDPNKGAAHLYTSMQESTASPHAPNANKQRNQSQMYYNTSDVKPLTGNTDHSGVAVSSGGNIQTAIYSNLKLSPE